MILEGFPLPVTVLPDEDGCLVVHRYVRGAEHLDERHCWCRPAVFTQDELHTMSATQFNAAVKALTEVMH